MVSLLLEDMKKISRANCSVYIYRKLLLFGLNYYIFIERKLKMFTDVSHARFVPL